VGDLRELAQAPERVPDVEQEPKPVRAHGSVLGQDEHLLEECVEQRPELGSCFDGRSEVAGIERGGDLRVDSLERLRDLDLRLVEEQSRVELGSGAFLLLRKPACARVGRVDRPDPLVGQGGECLGQPRDAAQVAHGSAACGAHVFDRRVQEALEALLDELGDLFLHERTRYREVALGREPVEADRGAPEAVGIARTGRPVAELEGHVGGEYSRLAGYPEAVSAAIDEQYLPDAADAPLPQTQTGRVLSAADKIDTLNVSFELGHRPTGSRDPHGLRRTAIGLDRLATEGNLSIPRALMEEEVAEFVEERFEGLLNAPVEYVRAARRASVRDLGGVARLAQALAALPDERFGPIHTAYTRASRLAEKEEGAATELNPALLLDQAEVEVSEALERVDPQIAAALDAGDFGSAVEAAAELGPLLDTFFEQVLVLAEDRAVRANRLRLLLNVRDTLGRLGELSQIPH
jgi:hypothetical protein